MQLCQKSPPCIAKTCLRGSLIISRIYSLRTSQSNQSLHVTHNFSIPVDPGSAFRTLSGCDPSSVQIMVQVILKKCFDLWSRCVQCKTRSQRSQRPLIE